MEQLLLHLPPRARAGRRGAGRSEASDPPRADRRHGGVGDRAEAAGVQPQSSRASPGRTEARTGPGTEPSVGTPRPAALQWGLSATSELETRLKAAGVPKVVVKLTDNRTTMISFRRHRDVLYLRVHRAFARAPGPVLDALAGFVGEKPWTSRRALTLRAFIEEAPVQRDRIRRPRIQPRGEVHDLMDIFAELNATYFDGRVEADITWSIASRGGRTRRTVRLGTYCDDLRLIRIHPALDAPFVPRFYVASVVHHEMLHQLHPVERRPNGRRIVHPPAFRADEEKFAFHAEAKAWEREHLPKLLRAR